MRSITLNSSMPLLRAEKILNRNELSVQWSWYLSANLGTVNRLECTLFWWLVLLVLLAILKPRNVQHTA